jgi:phosphate-selective porin OprO/OprP
MLLGVLLVFAPAAHAAQGVTAEILEILRDTGKVSESKYEELRERATAEEKTLQKASDNYKVYWKSGLRVEAPDNAFKLKIGGRIQNDWAILKPSSAIQSEFDEGSTESGGKIRRARLYVSGSLFENFVFKAQYDFVGGKAGIKDLYLGARGIPFFGTILIGHMKEPSSLDQLTSTNNNTFMERGAGATLDAARNTGITMYPRFFDSRLGWDLGAYLDTGDSGGAFDFDSEYNMATRVYGLPWWAEDGRQMFYAGVAAAHQFRNDGTASYSGRPNTSFGPKLIATGDMATNGTNLINLSLASVSGPFTGQAEYSHSFVDATTGPDLDFYSWFVEASWTLTGEHRPFNRSKGAFSAIQPAHPVTLGKNSGWGAFQVAARHSRLNLNSGAVQGGELRDTVLGINWYLNSAFRWTINYIYSERDPIGSENIWQTRFQVVF